MSKTLLVILLFPFFLLGNTKDQIIENTKTAKKQTEKIMINSDLQVKDLKIKYLSSVNQLNLIHIQNIQNKVILSISEE